MSYMLLIQMGPERSSYTYAIALKGDLYETSPVDAQEEAIEALAREVINNANDLEQKFDDALLRWSPHKVTLVNTLDRGEVDPWGPGVRAAHERIVRAEDERRTVDEKRWQREQYERLKKLVDAGEI